ncbi:carbohydrate ABC transporter permease [Anaerocolumna sedimenticola]|uniref:carbohydrate ABC transporter permease n=1 Tax=Anaerocolumna sedimenticola TaxID=2696063 RepID=UPI001FE433A7|nr:sugar ABC transporter permease [Anaerocolumna sedimenticola]
MFKRICVYWNKPAKAAYLFLLPSLLTLFMFAIIPLFGSVIISFMNLDIYFSKTGFTGIHNFIKALMDDRFWNALKNTLIFAFVEVPLQIVIGLLVANAISTTSFFSKMSRTIFFLPVICSMAAVGIMWSILFDGTIGFIPYVLKQLGFEGLTFFRDPDMAMGTVIAMTVWKNFGYTMSILVVGIQSISTSYFEAAKIDGASKVNQFFYITIPCIIPNLGFCLITNLIGSLQVFDQVYVTTQGDLNTEPKH